MLTASEAADIARQTGLTLADAVALRMLADTPEEAVDLAARFGAEGTDANFAGRLLGGADRPANPIDIDRPAADPEEAAAVAHLFGRPTTTTDPGDNAA